MRYPKTKEKRLYDSRRWRTASKLFLSREENILCHYCLMSGRETPATVVHHITPHKGDYDLFWDESNWMGLCKECHDRIGQITDNGGLIPGCDADGNPVDPNHPWNRKG